jgi:hypothetical protein
MPAEDLEWWMGSSVARASTVLSADVETSWVAERVRRPHRTLAECGVLAGDAAF